MNIRCGAGWVLTGLMLATGAAQAQGTDQQQIDTAEILVRTGQPAQAYRILEPLEFKHAGEVVFDYMLGVAALDSGKPDRATLAFERVLAVNPSFAGARLDMARAYYQLGDLVRAKMEFTTVLQQHPPQAARATIQRYLDDIASSERARKTRIAAYVEASVGHDNNIANSATQTFTFAPNSPWVGLLVDNQLTPAAKLSGAYTGVNAGLEVNHQLKGAWSLFANADLRQHGNMHHTAYDTISLDAQAGLGYSRADSIYKLAFTAGHADYTQSMRRDSTGLSAAWQYALTPRHQFNAFGQLTQNRASGYPATDPTTDARIEGNTDLQLLGVGWLHVPEGDEQALFGNVYAALESDVAPVISAGLPEGGRMDGKKYVVGLRAGTQVRLGDKLDGFASLGWQSAHFGNINNLIMANREETQLELAFGLIWRQNDWMLKPLLSYTSKNSNIALYSFNRMDASLSIRRDFK